ncbi:MAG: hypothetical protein AAF902_21700 [Chloroflexota bacterium]
MELTGSRTSGNDDFFSDWDFLIDSRRDFRRIYQLLERALVWRLNGDRERKLLTVVGPKGEIFKFGGSKASFVEEWSKIEKLTRYPDFHYYWVLAFLQLKVMHREYDLLVEVGIERLVGLMRDIYLKRTVDIAIYKDSYSYRKVRENLEEARQVLSAVTGLPYQTEEQQIEKLLRMNEIIDSIAPDEFHSVAQAFESKLRFLKQETDQQPDFDETVDRS